ncbi:MAG: amidase [Dokdonella sp.]
MFRSGTGQFSGRDPTDLDLADAADAVRKRVLSPLALTRACLERIERINPSLNAFITVTAERAMADAHRAEREIESGHWRGPLHGIPIALKDNIDTAGILTTGASAAFADRIPQRDADVVLRLASAGAVFLGKLNMHEFAMGTTSAISHYGPVRNPWNLDHVAGGSSGGSAAAVAARLCFGAVGTDTGGSIRIPAACCGIVGLKPTYDLISTRGTIPVSPSFDHVGPMCRSVADTALMLGAMTDDPLARQCDPARLPGVATLRVGILPTTPDYCDTEVSADVAAAFAIAVEVIRSLVAQVGVAQIPVPDLGALIDFESYAYHASVLAVWPDRYDPRTRQQLMDGRALPEAKAASLLARLVTHRATVHAAFEHVDLVVIPTIPHAAIAIGDAVDSFAQPACTFPFSIGGLPAISLPCGFSCTGLPIGLLIGGPPRSEPRVLALARAYERRTLWHQSRPPSMLAIS